MASDNKMESGLVSILVARSVPFVSHLFEKWYLVIGAALILHFLRNRYGHGICRIPGPILQSGSRLPRLFQVAGGNTHVYDEHIHQKYGKIVRIGPNLVSVSDAAEINNIYGTSSKFYKSSFYHPSTAYDDQDILPDPFILKDKELHSRMKRYSANAYSLISVVQLEGYVDDTIEKLFQQLDQQAKSGDGVVDLGRLFVHFAMDAIFNITFGQTLDFLDSKDGSGMLTALEKMIAYTGTIGQMPWLHKYLLGNPVINRLWIGEMGFETGLIQLATARVKQFRDSLSKRDPDTDAPCTFTERLLLNQASSPKMLTDREIEVHAFGNITPGSDTTSIALRAIFYFLLKYPETYVKLCEEVRESGVYPVKYHDAHKLPYLGAVIKEAMRLHPSMAILLGRTVPAGGATVCGNYLPEGTEVGISAWVVHRDPQIFPEPHKFRPERWLTQDQDLKARMNRAFFTFGAGTHTCSGRHISMMEIEKVVPDMLLKYDIELAYPDREWTFSNRMFTPQEGVLVKLRKRH